MGALKEKLKKTFVLDVYLWCKKNLKRVKNRCSKYYLLRYHFPKEYNKYKKLPVQEDKVVFVEVRLPEVTNSFKLLYDELVRNYELDVHCHFLRNSFVSKKEYNKRCTEMIRDIATAKYVFVNEASNVISSVKMRPETIVTQTWHGCGAFKKFGFSTAELIFGDNRKEMLKFPYYKNYTNVTLSSPEVAWAYEEAMNLHDHKEVLKPVGTSRTDVFFDEDFKAKAYEKLHDIMPSSIGKKVILFAPTFRGRVANGQSPDMLNVEMFHKALSEEYVLIFKHHPLVKRPPKISPVFDEFAQDFTNTMSIEELLCVADICISDYSSLVFEYSLLERPLIFFSYDLNEYFDWRGFYYDYYELAPGPIFTKNLEMIDYIKNIDTRFDKQRIIDFKNKFMSSCDGHATERIIDLVFEDRIKPYKRQTPLIGEFHKVPDATKLFSANEDEIQGLWSLKEKANNMYSANLNKMVDPNKVVFIEIVKNEKAFVSLKHELAKHKELRVSTYKYKGYHIPDAKLIEEIATAKYIVLANPCELINVLEMRKETVVVQLWESAFPSLKFGYSTKEVISGYNKKRLEAAPLHKNYGLVPVASEGLVDTFAKAFNITDPSVVKPIGASQTDSLFDQKFKKKALEKLYNMYPNAKDKKIIFYMPQFRYTLTLPKCKVVADPGIMNEYLSDEYVVLCHYNAPTQKEKLKFLRYYDGFIKDMTDVMSMIELLSIADIMVGDYRPETFLFAATKKPIILYAPDYKTYFYQTESYFDYKDLMVGPVVTDTYELVDVIKNVATYDYTKLEAFRKKYLAECDGNASRRLVEYMLENK
ncbi:MAG: CDP-glycerol glycerophosphotransferase family protein [bacterium]|nr:CDP-glycerol glycerophosphotransferase family protein [bacterium]